MSPPYADEVADRVGGRSAGGNSFVQVAETTVCAQSAQHVSSAASANDGERAFPMKALVRAGREYGDFASSPTTPQFTYVVAP